MISEVNAEEFRANAGDLLSRVQLLHGSVLIRENGEPVAALVDAELYRRLMWQRFDELTAPIREAFKDIPEEIGLAEIDEAVRHFVIREPGSASCTGHQCTCLGHRRIGGLSSGSWRRLRSAASLV